MAGSHSPFSVGFGKSPPLLSGRDQEVGRFEEAFDSGPGHSHQTALIVGPRGYGKTVLLNAIEDAAWQRGWVALSTSATRGFTDKLVESLIPTVLKTVDINMERRSRMTGIGGLGFSLNWEPSRTEEIPSDIRFALVYITDMIVDSGGAGVLLTVDEIGPRSRSELEELASAVQHLVRDDYPFAFVGAGIPENIADLLSAEGTTFIRRAYRSDLSRLTDAEVREALRQPIQAAGRNINADALTAAVEAVQGYPYAVQLIGQEMWQHDPDAKTIEAEAARSAAQVLRSDIGRMVHDPALVALSNMDRAFLIAMAQDDGPSKMSRIGDRIDREPSYLSMYRKRLLDASLIESPGHGVVQLSLPFLRDHLRNHYNLEYELAEVAMRSNR
ncbi:MAG: AAA family ATPase [Acidimicrobiales bacterium]